MSGKSIWITASGGILTEADASRLAMEFEQDDAALDMADVILPRMTDARRHCHFCFRTNTPLKNGTARFGTIEWRVEQCVDEGSCGETQQQIRGWR